MSELAWQQVKLIGISNQQIVKTIHQQNTCKTNNKSRTFIFYF